MLTFESGAFASVTYSGYGHFDSDELTGGIGEHDEEVRAEICDGLSWFGIGLVRVFTSQEDEQIARHTWELLPGVS